MNETIVSVRGVSKAFGAVRALQDVSLTVQQGMVTAIVGDNGSGKSTPDPAAVRQSGTGQRQYHRRRADLPATAGPAALDMGIRTVYQDLSLDAGKNSYENIFPGPGAAAGTILDRRRMAQEAGALLQQLEIVIRDLTAPGAGALRRAAAGGRHCPPCASRAVCCCLMSRRRRWAFGSRTRRRRCCTGCTRLGIHCRWSAMIFTRSLTLADRST